MDTDGRKEQWSIRYMMVMDLGVKEPVVRGTVPGRGRHLDLGNEEVSRYVGWQESSQKEPW